MFLLDTNVISELRKAKSGKADEGVTRWAMETPTPLMFTSVICLHELEHGVLLKEHSDPPQGQVLRTWLDQSVVPAFASRFLPVTPEVARHAASLHVPDPAPFRDALIAATAHHHRMTVITRNVKDFERFNNIAVTNPWNPTV